MFFFFILGFFLFLSFFSHHALLSASRAELLYLPPPAEGNLGPFFSVLQTIKTRRSPHRPARQHHRSQPGTRAMYKAWRGSCGTASDLRYGRKATTRHVAAKMPAQCVCRLLLFGWMVWEALAKSLPDLPVGESPYVGGMQHNEEMGVVVFFWPFAAAALSYSACVKSVDIGWCISARIRRWRLD